MMVLYRHGVICPLSVFRGQCTIDSIEAMLSMGIKEREVGIFLVQLFRCMDETARQKFDRARLYRSLDGAEILGTLNVLACERVVEATNEQHALIRVVELARHGSAKQLAEFLSIQLGKKESNSTIVRSAYHRVPLLFQPLIDCENDWVQRLRLLIDSGADATHLYKTWNCTALHMLLYEKEVEVGGADLIQATRLLVKAGVDLTVRDSTGRTSLIQAAASGLYQVCKMLLEEQADASVQDDNGNTGIDYLFYLKHSVSSKSKRLSKGYSCRDFVNLVSEYNLSLLLSDELIEDSRGCPKCRLLIPSILPIQSDVVATGLPLSLSMSENERASDTESDIISTTSNEETLDAPSEAGSSYFHAIDLTEGTNSDTDTSSDSELEFHDPITMSC